MQRHFQPRYLMWSGTYQCNLACPHCCVPIEWPDRLPVEVALSFLEQAHAHGIRMMGFTGGEPFLYPEFVLALTERAATLGFKFDKIQTNGVWFKDPCHLDEMLTALKVAGFSGKLGLSVDKFHGMELEPLADFCRAARQVFNRDNILSISYASRAPTAGMEPLRRLAQLLDGVVEWSPRLRRHLLVSPDFTITLNWNHLAPVERAEKLSGAWDGTWFEEDYCEGPGQALVITPKGEVKPCCGFASDLDQLTIGNIHTDTLDQIITQARQHPFVGRVFSEGLLAIKDEILAREPNALPGVTSNQCYLCWYVLTKGIFDRTRHGEAEKVGMGGQWEKLKDGRLSLPVL